MARDEAVMNTTISTYDSIAEHFAAATWPGGDVAGR